MTKLLFSVRITEKFFSSSQIKSLEQELESFNSKSEFMRKIIKFYLTYNKKSTTNKEFDNRELKDLIAENNSLLQELANNNLKLESKQSTIVAYQGEKQEDKTNQALRLLEQF
ncbi:MAG: hypothetical protein ACQEP9_04840 [Bacillota bacterium]